MAKAQHSGELILIRHAQSEWNALGRWQGHADPPLSPLGRTQAEALAESFGFDRVDALYVSDLRRAVETAMPLAKKLGLEATIDPVFRELDVGRWSGLVREEIEAREPELLREFDSGDPRVRPGGGETRGELRQRARERIALVAHEHAGERVVVVTHLGFIRALLPDAEPENASALRVSMHEALTARQPDHDSHPARAL
jgi:broad specificity phosphatase PhoE